jgi:hypothetical protein
VTATEGGTGWPPGDPAHKIQAAAEAVDLTGTITLRSRTFRMGPLAGSNLMAGLTFAQAQETGLTTEDTAGQAAMHEVIRSCFLVSPPCGACEACDEDRFAACKQLDEGEWPAFQKFATAICADEDEIFGCLTRAVEQQAARPTRPLSGSSPKEPATSPRSRADSSPPPGEVPEAFRRAAEAGDLINISDVAR